MTCATTWLLSEICVFINYARFLLGIIHTFCFDFRGRIRVGLLRMINSPRLIRRLAKWRGKHSNSTIMKFEVLSRVNQIEIISPDDPEILLTLIYFFSNKKHMVIFWMIVFKFFFVHFYWILCLAFVFFSFSIWFFVNLICLKFLQILKFKQNKF